MNFAASVIMEQNQIEDDSEKPESPLEPEEVAAIAVSDG